ncbi:MAG TPA: carboxylating nicotinate-nucleotide diphosphorylase [Niabella sp.]|nr:carboxylating nicotinate-nucleotide diphosphorylase [Niabella sp.]HOZ97393.1 carboxylating nicotinate-nucleotide diphosphorylase [Niabella sp.]HQW15239.1 carboxylating nicotinate-nucleotide diphosphorylase [Niabella sp.]HQX20293.1 carboxylating nicotinate-nucleotide diphosphorylase [Niabella sp.]HQX42802.1 carboxylating nicotinate-nucleotide diphosphorylase [Niabella sp.]
MNQEFKNKLEHLVTEALLEDIGTGDHSTLSSINAEEEGRAVLKIKQEGVLAGVDVARFIFNYKEPGCSFTQFKEDGELMVAGEKAFEVAAHEHTILECERLVLNCMQRMSGIATLTRQYTDKLKGYKTKLLDTRKTTPNFRLLEKEAVRIGGGVNHRFGLYDMIMLKDNHIDYSGGIVTAIDKAYTYIQTNKLDIKIEVETRTLDDVKKVIEMGVGKVFRVMLDNFSPEQIKEALDLIDGRFETEASGGINLNTIESYAATGVDYVSVGGLIHQARSLDLSLKAVV